MITYIRYIPIVVNIVHTKKIMGRKKLWPERLTLPLTSEMVADMDAALQDGESRVDLIREAIDRELQRRKRRR